MRERKSDTANPTALQAVEAKTSKRAEELGLKLFVAVSNVEGEHHRHNVSAQVSANAIWHRLPDQPHTCGKVRSLEESQPLFGIWH